MRVVLDTNVLLSALLTPQGFANQIYQAWRGQHRLHVITSQHQLDELRKASRYPHFAQALQPPRVGTMVNHLQAATVLGSLHPRAEINDPTDAYLLAMSEQGQADYLVTGDKRAGLLQLVHYGRTRIVTPRQFCETVL
jgi:uncharacterized protein